MNLFSFKITALLLICFSCNALAQISSTAFLSEETQYSGSSPNDPIFYYKDISTAALTAPSDGSVYNFRWYSYSTTTNSFDVLVQSDLGSTTSSIMNIIETGYMVSVDNGAGITNNYYCWNFVPAPQIDSIGIPNKPSESCDNLRLTAHTKSKILRYYDHHGDKSAIDVDYGYTWSSDPKSEITEENDFSVYIAAPYEDTEYTVVVGEKFAPTIQSATANKAYEAIAVLAKFSFETEGTPDNEAKEGSAPLVVRFTGQDADGEPLSQGNITDWEWTFGNAGKDYVPNPIFTFQKYGDYPVVLTVQNFDAGCESSTDPEIFKVHEMVIKVPNAFTPFSSPGENDEFRVLFRSVKKFNILIYNRWGRKVYQSGNPEVGWDGKIGSQKAEPGVYFYQIEAEGFNEGENETYEGAVHLIVN